MKVLFDTSVLVAALVQGHPVHDRARPWLSRALAGEIEFLVAAHTLLELFAVLTRMPTRPRIQPGPALTLIRENVEEPARVVTLGLSDHRTALRRAADLGLSGGVIYDLLIAVAADKADIDTLLTLNPGDFRRAWPKEGAKRIQVP